MLTRRENLLVRPWQQRRYHQHRRKVESALPVIDVGPPAERGHVSCKLKRVQSEEDRCAQVGRDNCALVLRLAHIMRTSRVDNVWRHPPPSFLRRVGIYLDPSCPFLPTRSSRSRCRSRPSTVTCGRPSLTVSALDPTEEAGEEEGEVSEGRNLRCSACHPRTARLKSQPPAPAAPPPPPPAASKTRHHSAPPPAPSPRAAAPSPACRGPIPLDQVVITYKALRLAISFPPHASVRIRSAHRGRERPSELRSVRRGKEQLKSHTA